MLGAETVDKVHGGDETGLGGAATDVEKIGVWWGGVRGGGGCGRGVQGIGQGLHDAPV